jgi:hypothetical protein
MAGLSQRTGSAAAGALLKLFVLATEKDRLGRELVAAERRRIEIQDRLIEIADKEARLQAFVKDPPHLQTSAAAKTARQFQGVHSKEIQY